MARYYMPTFITDLHQRHGKQYVQPYPGIASGYTEVLQVPEFDVEQADVNADNQTRWNSAMKRIFDWGHLAASTSLEVYPESQSGDGRTPNYGNAQYFVHELDEMSKPYLVLPADQDEIDDGITAPHDHPEAYSPGIEIPENSIFPYIGFVASQPSSWAVAMVSQSSGTPDGTYFTLTDGSAPRSGGWIASSVETSLTGPAAVSRFRYYTSGTPHGGWFLYGQFGVSALDEPGKQVHDVYWITPKFYKIRDYTVSTGSVPYPGHGTAPFTLAQKNNIQTSLDPADAHKTDSGWAELDWYAPGVDTPEKKWFQKHLVGGPTQFDGVSVWEFRGEYFLDKITPGLGFLKRREYAQVFPLMNLLEERETFIETTTGILREDEMPIPRYKVEEETLVTRKKVAEYGL